MHEGGVADNCNGLVLSLRASCLVEAVKCRDRSSHADSCVNCEQRSCGAKGVAADVAGNCDLVLAQAVEQASVGTSRTHYRRSYRDIVLQSDKVVLLAKELLSDNRLGELADVAEDLLALNVVHADIAAVLLDDAVKLLDNVDLVVLCGKVLDQLHRERIHHAQLQDRSLVAESLLYILVSGAVGDNAELSAVRDLHTVER